MERGFLVGLEPRSKGQSSLDLMSFIPAARQFATCSHAERYCDTAILKAIRAVERKGFIACDYQTVRLVITYDGNKPKSS